MTKENITPSLLHTVRRHRLLSVTKAMKKTAFTNEAVGHTCRTFSATCPVFSLVPLSSFAQIAAINQGVNSISLSPMGDKVETIC